MGGGSLMDLLYCGDQFVRKGIFLSLSSICRNTKKKLRVIILTANVTRHVAIDNSFREFLEDYIKCFNDQSEVILVDLCREFEINLPKINLETRFTPLCMLRLFSSKVDVIKDKILYLDTDVMCLGDFSEFYDTELGDVDLCGVSDRYGKWLFGNVFRHDYLNSGVLLLNMKRIRKDGLFTKCIEMCKSKKMFMPDQSAINKLAIKKKAKRRFNEQGKIKKDTIFKHFTTFFRFIPWFKAITIKPWDIDKVHEVLKIHEFDLDYKEYQKYKNIIEGE